MAKPVAQQWPKADAGVVAPGQELQAMVDFAQASSSASHGRTWWRHYRASTSIMEENLNPGGVIFINFIGIRLEE
jgi:hypothetical protein